MEAYDAAALLLVVVFDLLDHLSSGTEPCIGSTMVAKATTGVIGAIADAVALFGR